MRRECRSGSIEASQSDRFIQEGRKTQHESASAQERRGSEGTKEDKSEEEKMEETAVKDTLNSQEREQRDAGKAQFVCISHYICDRICENPALPAFHEN